ncbi:MAG: MaoC family dehydratase N-terminal domain-containing protein [Acidimicrobiales bacterium]
MTGRSRTGYDIATGTYEEARAMIGHKTEVRFGEVAVNQAMVKQFAALVHDGSAGYWDPEFAEEWWGGTVSPPAMLMTWLMPLEWTPEGTLPLPLLTARVPLPGDTFVNASNETEYFLPIREGDRLNVVEELVDVSKEKRTALGAGHFVTTRGTYRRQDGAVVAVMTNVLFRFSSPEGA